jgi:hypothetical protein
MRKLRASLADAFAKMCPFVFAEAQDVGGDGDPSVRHSILPDRCGPNCRKIRVQSPTLKGATVNHMVVYCPLDFPRVMHCATIGTEAAADKTDISDRCPETGRCSAVGLRKNTGPQNQAIEIVEKPATRDVGCSHKVMGCWAYDLDHIHLPYTTEVLCCR